MLGILSRLLGREEEQRPQVAPQAPQPAPKIGGQFGNTLKAFGPQTKFKMYEDDSFSGDPSAFRNPSINLEDGSTVPRYKFWEDRTFTDNAARFRPNTPAPQPDILEELRRRLGL